MLLKKVSISSMPSLEKTNANNITEKAITIKMFNSFLFIADIYYFTSCPDKLNAIYVN